MATLQQIYDKLRFGDIKGPPNQFGKHPSGAARAKRIARKRKNIRARSAK